MSDSQNTVDYMRDLEAENRALQAKIAAVEAELTDLRDHYTEDSLRGQLAAAQQALKELVAFVGPTYENHTVYKQAQHALGQNLCQVISP